MPVTVSALDIYRVLRLINPSPYLFYLRYDQLEIVGSSPERLVQVQDRHVEIHPIAGTRPRGETPEEDKQLAEELLADEKERAEHYMLVDLARNDVGRIATYGSVKTPKLVEIGLFSHVMHIVSKVTGELHTNTQPLEALMASFPAGTVSGAPKIRAMEILQKLEPTKRGIYAGAIGYLGYDGNIDSCIAIRTMTIQNGKATIQAGAGIVADSDPESEYKETQNKAKALIRAVQVAESMFQKKEASYHV
jgi:anthranilate synthase component I